MSNGDIGKEENKLQCMYDASKCAAIFQSAFSRSFIFTVQSKFNFSFHCWQKDQQASFPLFMSCQTPSM